jgi:hypothetical protein
MSDRVSSATKPKWYALWLEGLFPKWYMGLTLEPFLLMYVLMALGGIAATVCVFWGTPVGTWFGGVEALYKVAGALIVSVVLFALAMLKLQGSAKATNH